MLKRILIHYISFLLVFKCSCFS